MSKDIAIILLGFWVAVLPFLGFPNSWDRIMYVVSGIGVVLLMVLLRREIVSYLDTVMKKKAADVYMENDHPEPLKSHPRREKPTSFAAETQRENIPDISSSTETPSPPEEMSLPTTPSFEVVSPKRRYVRRKKISVQTDEPTP